MQTPACTKIQHLSFWILFTTLLWTCQKDDLSGACTLCILSKIKSEYCLTQTVNEYLSRNRLGTGNPVENEKDLRTIAAWLKTERCVSEAQVRCNSCIYTNPPISEILLLNTEHPQDTVIIDIRMTSPFSVASVHFN